MQETSVMEKVVAQVNTPPAPFDPAEFYPQVAALVPGIIYVFNHETNSNEYSNHSIATMLGYGPQEILDMGEDLFPRIIHPDDFEGLLSYLKSLSTLSVGDVAHHEYRAVSREGATVWLRSNDTVFQLAEDGSVLRHIGCASDVTAEKQRERRLAEYNSTLEARIDARTKELAVLNASLESQVIERTAQLERINEELEQLTYITTHDLKGPITNLTHLTDMLAGSETELSDEQARLLHWMRTSCSDATAKLDALVGAARSRNAELSPCKAVSVMHVAKATCETLKEQIEECRAAITFDFDAATTVHFPPFEVSFIIENLISNALTYTVPDRRPLISLRSFREPDGICLVVRDNGSGLNLPLDEAKVFGLFKRAHVGTAGNGIALYTIRKTMQRYGGAINVESVQGKWTEFTLMFPYAPSDA